VFVFGASDSGTTAGTLDSVMDWSGGDAIQTNDAGTTFNYSEVDGSGTDLASSLADANGQFAPDDVYVFVDNAAGNDDYLFWDQDNDQSADLAINLGDIDKSDIDYDDII
jgi:hypothetical protein